MDTNKITTSELILIIIVLMGLINGLMSCSSVRYNTSLVTGSTQRVSKHDIRMGMESAGWEYRLPEPTVMIPGSKSHFVFEYNK